MPIRTAFDLTTGDDTLQAFTDALASWLEIRACRYESFPFSTLLPRIERDRIVLPRDEPGVRSYAGWQPADGIELPVRYDSLTLGRFVLVPDSPTCGVAIPAHLREYALDVAGRAGATIAHSWLTNDRRVDAERGSPS